jgi:two-component system response regulator YesN
MTANVTKQACDVSRLNTEKLEQLLQSGRIERCRETVTGFLREIRFYELDSLMLRLYVIMDIYIVARSFSRELGIPNEQFVAEFGSIDEISARLQTVDSTSAFLCDMIEQCVRWRMETVRFGCSDAVQKAKAYIDSHYMDEDLTLKSVAEKVGLSPPYLSAVFKREMNENFSDYLTKVRIRHAKELLCRSTKLIYEVAEEVGFRDYRYFSQVFKRLTGQTPRAFQSSFHQS